MAYFALINLGNTIRCLEKFSRLSELPYSFDNLDFPLDEIESLKEVVEELDGRSRNKRLKAFDDKIREAAHGLEDVFDSVLSDLIRIAQSDDQSIGNQRPSVYEEKVRKGLNSFIEMVKEIKEEYMNKLKYKEEEEEEEEEDEEEKGEEEEEHEEEEEEEKKKEEDDDEKESSRSHFCEKKPKMVGSNTQELITKIKHQLNAGYSSSELRVVSIVGVAGSGRSTFAWNIFHDLDLPYLHKLRALVRVGPKYELKDILLSILSQIDGINDHKLLDFEGEEKIFEYLRTILKGGNYLIVLDDVRETRVWKLLRKIFPDKNNGSRVLLTTHLEEVAVFARSFFIHRMPTLHDEQSWNVISKVLFSNKMRCPPELEKAGKEIAKKCKGLLFEVARYADILSKVDQSPELWNNVAAEMVDFAVDAYDEMSEISKMEGDVYATHNLPPKMSEALGLPHATLPIWKNICMFNMEVAITGMAGIGKTALAREIFDDPWTLRSYEHRVWLTLGPKYQLKRIFADILAELEPNKMHREADEETLVKHINSILSGKKCIIVLDDVWDKYPWPVLCTLEVDIKCEILFTTRLSAVTWDKEKVHEMQLLNEEESWTLLRERVFGEELCPRELVKPGKLIAENCEGLPLMIVTVASLLLSRYDPKYWNDVATNKNSVFKLAYRKVSKILYPSYKNLKLKYRACFLYMAAFPVKGNIPARILFIFYLVEGIMPSASWTIEDFFNYMDYLKGESLVRTLHIGNIDTCSIHSVFWHFCVREARNDKFFHVMRTIADCSLQDMEKQRRLSVQNNVLFAIKDAYDSMASVSAARSLLCFGQVHPYQVPICLESKFLKVIAATSARFYEFPVEISTLVLLRHLALTYSGALPASLFKLWNLEYLIVYSHMTIKFPGDLSYVPVEIWEMKELKHLHLSGSSLPDPPNSSRAILDRLTTLIGVRAECVTKRILERIPNLESLAISIELEPDHAYEPSFSFDHISHHKRLQDLSYVIANPELIYAPPPFSMLPSCLRKLHLSGWGYAWEQMTPIALLPNLVGLYLECYAFHGAEWVMQEGYFKRLQHMRLEDTDLVNWRADDSCHLVSLRSLTIRRFFKLKEIPWQSIPRTCDTTLLDCNPLATKKIPVNDCKVICSWIEVRKL